MSENLADILNPITLGDNVFRAAPRSKLLGRVFGGQLLAQAVISAGRTVPPQQLPHSLHGYFERSGDPGLPIDYAIEMQREGRSSSRRRVVATQDSARLLIADLSFHDAPDDTPDPVRPPIDVEAASWTSSRTDPEMADTITAWLESLGQALRVEVRFFEEPARACVLRTGTAPAEQRFLVRPLDLLPDDRLVQVGVLAYLSDMFLLATSLGPLGLVMGDPRVRAVSLDHALWLHSTPRPGQWLLHETISVWSASGRALCHGRLYDQAGRALTHSAQEGLVKPLR